MAFKRCGSPEYGDALLLFIVALCTVLRYVSASSQPDHWQIQHPRAANYSVTQNQPDISSSLIASDRRICLVKAFWITKRLYLPLV